MTFLDCLDASTHEVLPLHEKCSIRSYAFPSSRVVAVAASSHVIDRASIANVVASTNMCSICSFVGAFSRTYEDRFFDTGGTQESMAEWWLLSKCSYVVFAPKSGFSRTAYAYSLRSNSAVNPSIYPWKTLKTTDKQIAHYGSGL